MTEYLLFFGADSVGNTTIWKSDGTTSGTQTIAAAAGLNSTEQAEVLVYGTLGGGDELARPGPVLFYADDKIYTMAGSVVGAQQDNNEQLLVWDTHGKSDLRDWTCQVINPYNGSSFQPQGFAAYDGLVYFNGQNFDTLTNELYSTDGTSVTQISPSGSGLDPSSLCVAFGQLFFSGNNGSDNVLYAYDGSGEPYQVADVYNPQYLIVSNYGASFFPSGGIGPTIPGFPPPTPKIPLFMSGQDSPGGPTWLYRYDADGSVTKIAPASAPSSGLQPYGLAGLSWQTTSVVSLPWDHNAKLPIYHAAVCFSGLHHNGKRGLWISGGTSETTTQIDFGLPSGLDLNPFNLTSLNGMLYFTGQDINNLPQNKTNEGPGAPGYGLYAYNPLTGDISEVINSGAYDFTFNAVFGGLNQPTMTAFNSDLYFGALSNLTTASSPETVNNLWRAHLDSQGNASPSPVYVLQDFALSPYSLTTTDDL
jgi:hypothetical protein